MNKIKVILLSWTLLLSEFLLLNKARAQGIDGAPGIDLTLDKLKNLIQGLACWLINIALVLIVIAVVFYGIQFLFSRGDPNQITKARESLKYAIIGIVVILGAYTIIASIGNFITEGAYVFRPLNC